MKNFDLIMYGGFALTGSPNLFTSASDDLLSVMQIQTENNARAAGRTVVTSDVDEKTISLKVTAASDPSREAIDVWNELMAEFEKMGRFLRVTPATNWEQLTPLLSADDYQLTGDATNRVYMTTRRILNAGIGFDILTGLSVSNYAKITNTALGGVDLSAYNGMGNFEVSLFVPDAAYVTSVQLQVGSDISNYATYLFTLQYDGTPISDGWNYFSIPWALMTITGAVDPNLMARFVDVQINYTADQQTVLGCVLGGIIWQNDDRSVNYKTYYAGFDVEKTDRKATRISGTLKLLNPEGLGESTSLETLNSLSGQTSASNSIVSTFEGTYPPRPVVRMRFSTVTNLSSVVLTNQTTGDVVTITPVAWAANDVVEFNLITKQVLINNRTVAYANVLPRFSLGRNKLNITLTSTSQVTISQTTNNTNLKGQA